MGQFSGVTSAGSKINEQVDEMITIERAIGCVEKIFGPLRPEDGVSERDVLDAELRLGIALPWSLRMIYRYVGKHRSLANGTALIGINELELNGLLAICEEDNGVDRWAISKADLPLTDPPVMSLAINDGAENYSREFSSVSEFFCFLVVWNVGEGALPAVGIRLPNDQPESAMPPQIDSIGELMVRGVGGKIRYQVGGVVLQQPDGYLIVGAQHQDLFAKLAKDIGVSDWDYLSWRDA